MNFSRNKKRVLAGGLRDSRADRLSGAGPAQPDPPAQIPASTIAFARTGTELSFSPAMFSRLSPTM